MTALDHDELREVLPESMQSAKRWLVWKLVPHKVAGKKARKVPFYANHQPRSAGMDMDSPADVSELGTLEQALCALRSRRKYAGVGFALGPDGTGNYWQGIDLDDFTKRPHLRGLVDDLPGYTETSPSGDGWHAFGYGRRFEKLGSNASGIEAYCEGRFFTVTGECAGRQEPSCLAEFVEGRLRTLHTPPNDPAPSQSNGTAVDKVDAATIVDLRSALLHLRADDRDLWIRMGHALKTLGDDGRGLWLAWSATSEKFDSADAARTWESFKPRATGYRAVFAEAKGRGWINPKASSAGTPPPDGRPRIVVAQGQLPRMVRESVAALRAARVSIYNRGGQLVRPVRVESPEIGAVRRSAGTTVLVPLDPDWMRLCLSERIDWRRLSRAGASEESGEAVTQERRVDAPVDVARMLSRVADLGTWPTLRAVVRHPVLHPDGHWLGTPGYHAGLLVDIEGKWIEPGRTPADADAALAVLRHHLRHYPWATPADEAVALSLLVTAVMRCTIDAAPMHVVDAPAAGTGKSLLADVVSILATGARASVMDYGRDPDEAAKRLDGMLLAGDALIAIDNVEAPLEGATLCQTLTQATRRVRPLGASTMVSVPCTAMLVATGNNVILRGDLVRRALVCRLDAGVERPELRAFDQDLVAETHERRAELVAACQTIVAAHRSAARPAQVVALGSFEQWSRTVRAALVSLGVPDPADVMERARADDPSREAIRAVVEQWRRVYGTESATAADAIARAVHDADLRAALELVAIRRGALDASALGRWLRDHRDTRVGAVKLVRHPGRAGSVRWAVDGGDGGHGGDVPLPRGRARARTHTRACTHGPGETSPPFQPSPPQKAWCSHCDNEGCKWCEVAA